MGNEPQFNLQRILAGRQSGPVGDTEDMGIDRHSRFTKSNIQHHVGGLSPDAGELSPAPRVSAVLRLSCSSSTDFRQANDIFCFVADTGRLS